MKSSPFFTVFTPTYNRGDLLVGAFNSLKAQSFRDFEWVVVDDGSTDNTAELVRQWAEASTFPIRYFWQTNQHKKSAHNRAVREARGGMFVILDSDDELQPFALESFRTEWNSIPESQKHLFFGIWALCVDEHGSQIGSCYPETPKDAYIFDFIFRFGLSGDKCIAVRTDVLREEFFPEDIPGFVPESLVWNKLGSRYLIRGCNERLVIVHRNHTDDSITKSQNSMRHAPGRSLYEREFFRIAWPWFKYAIPTFCKRAIQFTRFHLHYGKSVRNASKRLPGRWLILVLAPVGFIFYCADILFSKSRTN